MKLDSRKVTKIAGVMIAAGIGVSMIAMACGAKTSMMIRDGQLVLTDIWGQNTITVMENVENKLTEVVRLGEKITVEESISAIKRLDITVDTMAVNIVAGDEFGIQADYRKGIKFEYRVENDKLVVRQEEPSRWEGLNIDDNRGTVTIYIPRGVVIESIDVELGLGKSLIEGIQIGELEFSCGMGNSKLIDVTIEKGYIEGGMGDIQLQEVNIIDGTIQGGMGRVIAKDIQSNGLEVSIGVGSVEIEGELKGTTYVEGGMGSLKLTTKGEEADYNYDISKGLGSISVNSYNSSAMGDLEINNDAPNTIRIEGGVGSINVKTKK